MLEKIPAPLFIQAIVERFARTRITISEATAADVVERARDVPYDVQRFAHELWDDAIRRGLRQVDGAVLDATIIRLLGAQRPLLEGAWQRLTLAKRAVLRAVAHEGGRGVLAAPMRARYGLGPKSSVQRALAALAADDWLAREGDRYVFVDSLYREYVLRETR